MENHIKLSSGLAANSYIRQFQVAQMNFYLVDQEEKKNKRRLRLRHPREKSREAR